MCDLADYAKSTKFATALRPFRNGFEKVTGLRRAANIRRPVCAGPAILLIAGTFFMVSSYLHAPCLFFCLYVASSDIPDP